MVFLLSLCPQVTCVNPSRISLSPRYLAIVVSLRATWKFILNAILVFDLFELHFDNFSSSEIHHSEASNSFECEN